MKKIQRALALIMALCLMLTMVPGVAAAEEGKRYFVKDLLPDSVDAAAVSRLSFADLRLKMENSSIFYAGEQAQLSVTVAGGTAPYAYDFWLSDAAGKEIAGTKLSTAASKYLFTIPDADYFRLNVRVTDADGNQISFDNFETQVDRTLLNKVKAVVAECAPAGLTNAEKALNLYNWLCVNADYDYTFQWYTADGVLLHGTGVCDSFAHAYILMLKQVGIDCRRVVGFSKQGESHAWVLVKLDGEWYHMDPTWDEASDRRFYFGLNTELITRDHIIRGLDVGIVDIDPNVPVATATRYNYEMNRADGVFSSTDELFALFAALPGDQTEFTFYYTGSESAQEIMDWGRANAAAVRMTSWQVEGSSAAVILFSGKLRAADAPKPTISLTYDGVLVRGTGLTGRIDLSDETRIVAIAENAFSTCKNMTAIELPPSVVSIGANAFKGCDALTSIVLPASVTHIDGDILGGGSAVVHCPNGSYAMRWAMKHQHEYVLPEGSRIIVIPADTAEIRAEAFADNGAIQCVVIEDNALHTVGSRAFAGCASLISINLPESVSAIANDAFAGCEDIVIYCAEGSFAHEWCIQNNVTCIAE